MNDVQNDNWKTANDPMTAEQRATLKSLSANAKGSFDETLTQAEAADRIEELRARTDKAPPQDSALESLGKSITEPILDASSSHPGGTRKSGG